MNAFKYTLAALAGAFVAGLLVYRAQPPVSVTTVVPAAPPPPAVEIRREADPETLAELERARRENAELQAQLESARENLAAHDATLRRVREELAELRRPMELDVMSSTLRAEMRSGEAIVTGGHRLPDGKRLYAFATPVLEKVDGADSVRIEGSYLAVNDAAGSAAGLDGLATNAANTLQHGEVWIAEEQRAVMEQLAAAEGTDVLGYPSVSVRPGFTASIEVAGIQLKVTPELADGEGGLNVELRLEQPAAAVTPPSVSPEAP